MCGRFACSLDKDDLSCAASYKDPKSGVYIKIPCIFDVQFYNPSYNIPPTTLAPVIICDKNEEKSRRVIVLAQFGVVPPWLPAGSQNAGKTMRLETHLCRLETMTTSILYKQLLKNGGRCIIPCTGYYEWQSTKGANKQPYFFYNKENSALDVISSKGEWSEQNGWSGVKLLYLAGLYSRHMGNEGKFEYSFAIITHEADKEWSWVHHRMPIVFQSDEDINNWLDSRNVSAEKALEILKFPINNLKAHAVDKLKVNNTRNNFPQCVAQVNLKKFKSNFMANWLKKSKPEIENKETFTEVNHKIKLSDDIEEPNINNSTIHKTHDESELDPTDTQISEEDIIKNYIKKHKIMNENEQTEGKDDEETKQELLCQPLVDDSQYVNMKKRTYIAMDDKNCEMVFTFPDDGPPEKKVKTNEEN